MLNFTLKKHPIPNTKHEQFLPPLNLSRQSSKDNSIQSRRSTRFKQQRLRSALEDVLVAWLQHLMQPQTNETKHENSNAVECAFSDQRKRSRAPGVRSCCTPGTYRPTVAASRDWRRWQPMRIQEHRNISSRMWWRLWSHHSWKGKHKKKKRVKAGRHCAATGTKRSSFLPLQFEMQWL